VAVIPPPEEASGILSRTLIKVIGWPVLFVH